MSSSASKSLLVTGGSRGIGAAVATLAAQRGYQVALNYHTQSNAAQAVCDQITQAGGHAIAIQADVSQAQQVDRLFSQAEEAFGRLDVLVNNAAVLDRSIPVADMTADRINRILETNVTGTLLCSAKAVRRMSTIHGGRGGCIVNVSSVAALHGSPFEYVDYAASKGAIDSATVGLAKEVVEQGIRVNAVRPGIIDTDIHASGGEPDRVERIAPTVPMKRAGQPLEVAYAILWLASSEASYVTGSFINVTGGR
ncbi:MAG: glucose 1-dehydrogenase [Gammaproteobacteria bacterium]|nr:glucose 1-dehydrogenase [Gammaproteobacteria bacterium]